MFPEIEIPDVDLDVSDRDRALTVLRNFVRASQETQGKMVPHNTGVYFQRIPVDPVTDCAAFPYKIAEHLSYFKVDIIPNHVYDLVESNDELDELLSAEVDWSWFTDKRFFEADDPKYQLTHLAKYHHLCEMYPPQSVEDIACLIAVIRPRKRYLIGQPWEDIVEVVWQKLDTEDDKHYFFKKSHAVAFALLVVVHAQLIARHLSVPVETGEEPEGDYFI